MQKTLREIAKLIDADVLGDDSIVINGVAGLKEAREGQIAFLANLKYSPLLDKTQAAAVIVSRDTQTGFRPVVRVDNPSLAFSKIVSVFSACGINHPKGVHPSAIIGKNASIGSGAGIGAYVVIEDDCVIGDGSVIYPGCFIGKATKIGPDSLIYPNVTVRERTIIGSRVIIHSGTVIGSDGFGYVPVNGLHQKIPQIGIVEIEDDVEIGANVTIDRARFDKTVIGKGTKIDNLVQIAHNVIVGENSIIIAQAGISGSTTIGKGVTIAGQAGLVGHITVGDGAVLAAQAGITKSVPSNVIVSGYPAKPHETARKVNACVQNLPKLYETVTFLKKKIEELELKLQGKKPNNG